MRMWMVDPRIMCKNHLLGEHRELHMLAGSMAKNRSLDGYQGILEPSSIEDRHNALVMEMNARGYWHFTPMRVTNGEGYKHLKSDREMNLTELLKRCDGCRNRWRRYEEVSAL